MSCGAGTGVFVKLSRLFVKVHKWALLKMSMNCKLSGLNGALPASPKLREDLNGSNSVGTWRRKLPCLWFLCAVTIGIIWFLMVFYNWGLGIKGYEIPSCEGKAQVLLQNFNVSKNQLHALVSMFSESDQIASLQCTKEPGTGMQTLYGVACTLKILCSKEKEYLQLDKWIVDVISLDDQCPVIDDNILRKIDRQFPDESITFVSQSSISSVSQTRKKNVWPTREAGSSTEDCCEISFFGSSKGCWWVLVGVIVSCTLYGFHVKFRRKQKQVQFQLDPIPDHHHHQQQQQQHQQPSHSPPKGAGNWRKKLCIIFVVLGVITSIWLFWHLNKKTMLWREETLSNMCDERARMLQDQFNVSMNHVQALAILVSTFHHGKNPSAIDQETFSKYTERTAFERPLTSGVAYALKVPHSEREQFEKQHGTIKKMQNEDQTLVQDCNPEKLDPAPDQEEYAPVIFSQETVSHIISIDMMSGKEDRENILRARASGKGVLTSPFKLLKSNHVGVVLTFAVYNADLPPDATPEQRIDATVGYLGASYDVPSLVEKLLHQLASKQTIVVNVYDTTNVLAPILMYGTDVNDTGLLHISNLDFGDPLRKHEMHCRFKQKPPLPWTAINASVGVLVIVLLVGHIFHAAICRIDKVEEDYRQMMELKVRAEAADVAKSQFLATVSHEIRTPMNGVLGMLKMLMDTELDATQMEHAVTAYNSGEILISLINGVLDQSKIESGRLELEAVSFDLRSVLDNVLSCFSGKSHEQGIELAIYVSNQVPEVVIGDPVRFRQIITNLVGNSMKFTIKGHVFVSVHLADEVRSPLNVKDAVLKQSLSLVQDVSSKTYHTLSGFPAVDRWKSWEKFTKLNVADTAEETGMIRLLVTVEDTGEGIPEDSQSRIFTPFMQADSSTSRRYGGTGIGLSISKRLVDLMGGEIGFVSERDIGSTFSFTACFRKGELSSLDTKQQLYDLDVSEFQGRRALVIDDRSTRAEVTRYHLLRMGISVDIASSLKSSCSYLSSNNYHASYPADLMMVLIDEDVWDKETHLDFRCLVKEPKQNGGTEIQVNLPKVFLLATLVNLDERFKLKSAGLVDDVLMKPLRLSILISCFQEFLASGKKRQMNRKKPPTIQNLLKGKQILVVDDNLVNRKVAEGFLKRYGAVVISVDSGKASLEKLKPPHEFDACFMDFQMPEMDGFEATRRIRAMETQVNEQIASGEASSEFYGNVAHWHTPILAMTADVIQVTSEGCLKCGMDGYVSKPFEEQQLYEAVAPFLQIG